MMHLRKFWLILGLLLLALSGVAHAADDDDGFRAPTPPRLSFIDGEVSYSRQGLDEWVRARLNLPLAEGDALYAGAGDNFEVQFGIRSFARAAENTQLSLVGLEEHYIHFKQSNGLASYDIRSMEVGDTLEVSTPYAAFIIEHPGYFRVEVGSRETHFITYHGGRASLTTADGRSMSIYPSEEIVITHGDPARVATYAAPDPDAWDRWNDARSDHLGESVSARYLPSDVYGAEDLDHHGFWRVVPDYGPVWIPHGVPPGWVPYSTGSWVWDPYYEWTWIDDAPWGWAPFHYGRWVYIGSYWAWAPGPVVRRSVYCPALVAFLAHDHDVSVHIGIGLPGLWWVALSWGEPILPWWGHHKHRWHPRWDGWGGPRIVNNVVVKEINIINVGDIHFRNASVPRSILTTSADRFGRERFHATVEARYRHDDFVPMRDEFPVKPSRESLLGGAPKGERPSRAISTQPVVSTRPPRERTLPRKVDTGGVQPQEKTAPRLGVPQLGSQGKPEFRYVKPPPRREEGKPDLPRPPFGEEVGPERRPPPAPPRFEEMAKTRKPASSGITPPQAAPSGGVRVPSVDAKPRSRSLPSPGVSPPMAAPRSETKVQPIGPAPKQQSLPGKPANETFGGRGR